MEKTSLLFKEEKEFTKDGQTYDRRTYSYRR